MVLLTMTASIVEGLAKWQALSSGEALRHSADEPSLSEPAIDKPISHDQVVDLWKDLEAKGCTEYTLEKLLRGSRVFIPPPPPKPEPSDEYKALMARLRQEEEARAYERMANPPPPLETFSQRFPHSKAFAAVNRPEKEADVGDDDVTFNDVHRQLMLILNFLVSIVGVGATLWSLARWWSTPARLFLAMGGSVVVGVAEVGIYYFYLWHLTDASKKEKVVKERKEVLQTWVVKGPTGKDTVTSTGDAWNSDRVAVRRRKKARANR